MSYIRALGNPEGLYIIATASGHVEIFEQSLDTLRLPRHVFDGLLLRWQDSNDDTYFRGASLRQPCAGTPLRGLVPNDFSHWTLNWKGWTRSVTAWEVTWEYIAQGVAWRTVSQRTRNAYWNDLARAARRVVK